MTMLALLRHGPTQWSAEGRIQGRRDVPLSAAGSATVAGWRLPPEIAAFAWVTSPLRRAIETSAILGVSVDAVEPALIEMAWGAWEGCRLSELRAEIPGMAAREAAGLDLRPPDGESPRDVQRRLQPFLAVVARRGVPTAAVSHKGVIRALLALATGWDMTRPPPQRLADAALHLFRIDADGIPTVAHLNRSIER
jgi:broad specificity phosphatase PhoE